jgi:hypothetical protein
MAQREFVADFAKEFQMFPDKIEREVLRPWTQQTIETWSDARARAPVASGDLVGKSNIVEAKVTAKGIQSSVVFRMPYAAKLNDKKANIRLKEVGEISYYHPQKIEKKRKGELGYLDNAVEAGSDYFTDIASRAVSIAFEAI